ncbi:MAG: type 4a pilus biogenesis protein PilO [Micromonosporaceae bacterium]|nr:type 4a pilus biogenesis protein PilO [Micromonosporaceae bacterium]
MPAIPRDRLWNIATAAGVVLLLALGWMVLIGPAYDEAASIDREAETTEDRVVDLQRRLAQLRQQNQDLARYQQQLATDRQALPTQPALADLLRQIQAAGAASGTTMVGLIVGASTQTATAGGSVESLPVTVTVDGSAAQVAGFLDQMQRVQPRAVLINSMNAVPKDESGSFAGAVTLTLTMQIFVAPTSSQSQQPVPAGA